MQIRAALLEPYILRLSKRLQDNVGYTSAKQAWQLMSSGGDVDWRESATIALEELGHLNKATAQCFMIARRICREHGWRYDQIEQFKIGGYVLEHMIREGWCWIEWHPDKKTTHVVMVKEDELKKSVNTYTSFNPYPLWTSPYDETGKELIKPTRGSDWTPGEWHFNGVAPEPGEGRLWHPFIERLFVEDDGVGTGLNFGMNTPPVYKNYGWMMQWVYAAFHLENNKYRINEPMLKLIKKLDDELDKGLVERVKAKNPKRESTRRKKAARDKFKLLITEAERLVGETFYQRVHFDYRGRMYLSRSILNYQGDDLARSLIEFADGKPLDEVFLKGVDVLNVGEVTKMYAVGNFKWLLLHAANLYEVPLDDSGFIHPAVDGESPITDQRIDFAIDHLEEWIRYANDPVNTYDEWQVNHQGDTLDDPLQFIRACMELRDAVDHENQQPSFADSKKMTKKEVAALQEELIQSEVDQDGRGVNEIRWKYMKGKSPVPFISHLPIEQDQTNSVIQHLAMIYGSMGLAEVCNLLQPSNFYGAIAEDWALDDYDLTDGEKRKIVKKVVVPRCYGAGDESIVEQLRQLPIEALQEADDDALLAIANAGITHLENRVDEVGQFRLDVGRLIRGLQLPPTGSVNWCTPSGFEVHVRPETSYKYWLKVQKTKDNPFNKVKLVARIQTGRLNQKKVETSVPAAVIHSIDASLVHMMLFSTRFPLITIHDAFACHAANVDEMRKLFVEKLAEIHSFYQPFAVWQRDVGRIPLPQGLLANPDAVARQRSIQDVSTEIQKYADSIG